MAGAKEIRSKIASIKSTQKITNAMEKVAVSKMRKAQMRMAAGRPYAERIRQVIGHLANANPEYRHPFMIERPVKRVGYIVVSSDRGLAGGLNINLFKALVKDMSAQREAGAEIDLCVIGAKGASFFKNYGGNVVAAISHLGEEPSINDLIGSVKANSSSMGLTLNASRHDVPDAKLSADIAFAPAENQLKLKTQISEPRDGMLAGLLHLPGGPAVSIDLSGEGPLSNWAGKLQAALDGKPTVAIDGHHSLSADGLHHIDVKGGGDPSTPHKSPGRSEFDAITLERGVTHDPEFDRWANKVWQVGAGRGSEVSLRDFRKDLVVQLLNEAGQVALAYKLYRAWPSEYQVLGELDANGNAVAIQSLKLECEGWERDYEVPEPEEPSFTHPV